MIRKFSMAVFLAVSTCFPFLTLCAQTLPDGKPAVVNSSLDAQLFYQLLISEVRAKQEPGYAYQVYMQLAKQHQNGQLYKRSVDIALQARAGEQALAAARAWHQSLPQDKQALEYIVQILLVLNRPQMLVEPLRGIIQLTPIAQRQQVLLSLPRALIRIADRKIMAKVVDEVTKPWREPLTNLPEAWVASAHAWLYASDTDQAYQQLKQAFQLDSSALVVGLLAVEIMSVLPEAEAIAKQVLAANPDHVLRLSYASKLMSISRTAEAVQQLDILLKKDAKNAMAWLSLATAQLDLLQLDAAQSAAQNYIDIAESTQVNNSILETVPEGRSSWDPSLGYLKMAQIYEQRHQLDQADIWLQKADPGAQKSNIQIMRAYLMAMQGQWMQARLAVQQLPETEPRDTLVKIKAEAYVLRKAGQIGLAFDVLSKGSSRFPNDTDLMYELGMVAEQVGKFEQFEALMRQLISQLPEQANSFNALGYSFADRGIRLDEARLLLTKAIQLQPNDPFIIDSMGWLSFREGQFEEALTLLKQAYALRKDTEIAAHLGEVLWYIGQRDEAVSIWRDAQQRDPKNSLLKSTLERLKVKL